MRVAIVGGGPAGLYAALLLQQADPTRSITVYEARPPGRTFGWGVVFSDATLATLREADPPTYTAITEAFVRWTAISVQYGQARLRSDGHAFAGIARRHLLRILRDRCAALGVRLVFDSPVTDVAALTDEADLLIGADGLRSVVRERYETVFSPALDERRSRYIWFGTDRLLDAFTFIFRDSPHGLFQVHAYPFDGEHATFIVETSEAAWRAAGLDQADEAASIAFCEDLFTEDLRGARLLSNESRWIRFTTVRNRRWSHLSDGGAPVVLLGDAAHTAHFSIGSGTKLALEDAIALARSVQESPGDLGRALHRYELERRPVVELLQAAAQESLEYFEEVARYTYLDPEPFVFSLLTRSGRITYDNLRVRDPGFVEGVDRWFAGDAHRVVSPPPAFVPLHLGGAVLRNRIAVAAAGEAVAAEGIPSAPHGALLEAAVGTGAGLVLTDLLAVTPEGRITAEDAGLYTPAHAEAWTRLLDEARSAAPAGVVLGARLGHAGARAASRPRRAGLDRPLADGWPLVAPSAVPATPRSAQPRPLTEADLNALVAAYAAAAQRAAEAGFDLCQVDMADGYLLSGFLSPLLNHRTDGYGGSAEGRLRFPLTVIEAVRSVWPAGRPLAVRLTADELAGGGLDADDGVAIARALAHAGCHLVEVRAGWTTLRARPSYRRGFLVGLAERVRSAARVPVLVGGIADLGEANSVLAGGRADLCLLRWTREVRQDD